MGTTEGWPAGLEARPIDKADADAWAELLAAKEKVDQEGENYDADDLLEELADPKLDAARDSIGLWSGDQLVGYGVVRAPDHVVDVHRVRTEGAVHPEWRGRGVGAALIRWLNRRAAAMHEERQPGTVGEINTGAIDTNTGAFELLTSFGFEPCRYFFSMERGFGTPLTELAVPDGLQLVAFDAAYDEPLRLAHNEVFMDHWGSSPKDPDSWKTWFTGSRAFRGDLSYLVLDGDEIVAYSLGYEYVADTEATGIREVYVGQVGTRRSHRGRGLAAVALARVMVEAERTGYQRASLGVDAEYPTGALGLYERLGYTVKSKFVSYRLPIQS
jgi:mycothiol synthase